MRHVAARQHGHQLALGLIRHQRAGRVGEVRHQQARLHALLAQRLVEQRQIDAALRVGRHLDRPHAQALDELEHAVVTGRLDDDRVARLGHRAQAQVQRLHGAERGHHVVRGQRHPALGGAPRDLPPQRRQARRRIVGEAGAAGDARHRDHAAVEPLHRHQRVAEVGAAEQEVARIARRAVHPRDQIAHRHPAGLLGAARRARLRRLRRPHRAHVVPGLRPLLDHAAALEQEVRLQHGGDAHAALLAQGAHRGQPIPGAERALGGQRGQLLGELFVEVLGARLPGGLGPGVEAGALAAAALELGLGLEVPGRRAVPAAPWLGRRGLRKGLTAAAQRAARGQRGGGERAVGRDHRRAPELATSTVLQAKNCAGLRPQ
jgi:hypothetical protein